MYAFEYHRPTSLSEVAGLVSGKEDAKIIAGGQTLIPTLKQRLAQPSDVIDLGRSGGASRHPRGRRRSGDRRHDEACRSGRQRHRAAADPGTGRTGERHRRRAGPQPGHAGRLDLQQRPVGGLSCRTGRAERHRPHQQADDPGGRVLHRHVRDGAGAGRDRDGGSLPEAGPRRLRQVPQSGQPLRHGRRAGGRGRTAPSGWR